MLNPCRGKRKTWVTDSLTVQNPHGASKAGHEGRARRKEKVSSWDWGCAEKYNMYLRNCNRPQTTPVSSSVALLQTSGRLYVTHTGARVKKCAPRDSRLADASVKIQGMPESGWLRPPGTAPLGRIKESQKKWRSPNESPDAAEIRPSCPLLPSQPVGAAGVKHWKTVDSGSYKQVLACRGTLQGGCKGVLGGVSPYSSKAGRSPMATRKPQRMVCPKKEVIQTKLMREVERAREYAQEHRVSSQTLTVNERAGGQGAVYLSKRVGCADTLPFPHQGLSLTAPALALSDAARAKHTVGAAKGCWRGTSPPAGAYRCKGMAHNEAGDQNVCPHPLHRTTVNTPQQFVSRATYCQQLSTVSTQRGRAFCPGPAIVTPVLDVGEENISPALEKGQKMKGGMLMRSENRRSWEQGRPPLGFPGCLKTIELHSTSKCSDPPSPLGHKWTGNQESPRVKAWKFEQIRADAIARRTSAGDPSDSWECENLTIDGEGNRAGGHLAAEKVARNVEQLHDLLTLCDHGTDLQQEGGAPTQETLEAKHPVSDQAAPGEAQIGSQPSSPEASDIEGAEIVEEDQQEEVEEEQAQNSSSDVFQGGFRVLGGKYEVLKVVGEGAYGLVMKCRVREDPSSFVAIKEFKLEEGDPDAEEVKRTMKREVALLRRLQHPHVVQLIEHFSVGEKVFIVMEFVPMNLLEVLEDRANKGGLRKDVVRRVIFQVLSAIAFIHKQGVVYRDIKPENVLITEQGDVKLCDFGFARFIKAPEELLTDYVATRWYRAPELLLGPPFKKEGVKVYCPYGKPVDMWSIGCLMGELLDGEPLFAGDSDIDQLYKIQQVLGPLAESHKSMFKENPNNQGIVFNIKTPTTLSNRYSGKANSEELDFMEGLLDMNPHERKTSEDCLMHTYLQEVH